MLKNVNKKKLFWRGLAIVLLLGAIGLYVANRIVKKYGYDNLADFNSSYWHNQDLADQVNPTQLRIELGDSDYKFLEEKRQEALDRGIQINVGDNYVPCSISDGEHSIVAEIRLKGHMTDHLQGDKWSFRVKSDEEIMGMYRFSLQHPGTRGFVYEWVYHQLLKQEEIIYLNYDFVQVQLNEKDLGIYAVEEHFGQHVIERNGRPKGAILRWNPSLYWEWRIDELDGIYLDEEYSSFMSSYAEPYDKGTVKDDPELIANYQMGARLLEAFRRDSLTTSEVFDVEKMARFHAIIDLVGGHHSLDWSDIKFYYNSETKKIEPVGYESFSIRKTEHIAGQRLADNSVVSGKEYHDKLFSDPVFFEAYIQNLERICNPTYFKLFEESIQEGLNEKLGIIAKEWPHRRFKFDAYYENIELIKHNLDLPKPFHAFFEQHKNDSLMLSVGAVSDFPVIIDEVEFNGKHKVTLDYYLAPKVRGSFITYEQICIPFDKKKLKSFVFKAHIPGSKTQFEIEGNEYPSYQTVVFPDSLSNLKQLETVHELDGKLSFREQSTTISTPFKIEKDQELVLFPGQELRFEEKGAIVCEGKLVGEGTKDFPITISAEGNALFFNGGALKLTNAQLFGQQSFVQAKNAKIEMEEIAVADFERFLSGCGNDVLMNDVQVGNVAQVFHSDSSSILVFDSNFNRCDGVFLAKSSVIKLSSTEASAGIHFSELDERSELSMWNVQLHDFDMLCALKGNANFRSYVCSFDAIDLGFKLDESTFELEPFMLYRPKQQNFKQLKSS